MLFACCEWRTSEKKRSSVVGFLLLLVVLLLLLKLPSPLAAVLPLPATVVAAAPPLLVEHQVYMCIASMRNTTNINPSTPQSRNTPSPHHPCQRNLSQPTFHSFLRRYKGTTGTQWDGRVPQGCWSEGWGRFGDSKSLVADCNAVSQLPSTSSGLSASAWTHGVRLLRQCVGFEPEIPLRGRQVRAGSRSLVNPSVVVASRPSY